MRNFPGSLILPFAGQFGGLNITAHRKSNQAPRAVTLTIDWSQYAAKAAIPGGTTVFNAAVAFDLASGTTAAALDMVKSVYIDNAAVDRPVTLECPDTGHKVTCSDGSSGWYPLMTNGTAFNLYTDNIIPLNAAKQSTRLIFSNASFDTFAGTELNRAQQLFRASGASQFITPVIGDKIATLGRNIPIGTTNSTFIAAVANTSVILTSIKIAVLPNSSQELVGTVALLSNGVTVVSGIFDALPGASAQIIIDVPNSQVSVNGAYDLILRTTTSGGAQVANINAAATYAQIQLPAVSN